MCAFRGGVPPLRIVVPGGAGDPQRSHLDRKRAVVGGQVVDRQLLDDQRCLPVVAAFSPALTVHLLNDVDTALGVVAVINQRILEANARTVECDDRKHRNKTQFHRSSPNTR